METMPVKIQTALPADAPAIAAVHAQVWPAQTADPAQIGRALADSDHAAFVALAGPTVIGFVDGFLTRSGEGRLRWEVDLLAVRPDFQGRGIAARLVTACTEAGRQRGVSLARALIRVDNIPSRRTFARCGYAAEDSLCCLRVCAQGTESPVTPPAGLSLLPVNTFGYRGLWLEGRLTEAGFLAARAALTDGPGDIAGAVIPAARMAADQWAGATGFDLVGTYQWWSLFFDDESGG